MDAVKRIVSTYGGYDEQWSYDGRLSIKYRDEHSYELFFDGEEWSVIGCNDAHICEYLKTSASIGEAVEHCKNSGFSFEALHEFLPRKRKSLIPAELLRILMDEHGLGIYDACRIVARCFGSLCSLPAKPWLYDIQPRTANLQGVLADALKRFGYAVHDAYNEDFRSPPGAIGDGSTVRLSICGFGGVNGATLCVYSDEYNAEIDMLREGDGFRCSFTPQKPAALWYRFKLNTESGEKWLCPGNDGHFSVISDSASEGFRLTVFKRGFETPQWFSERIMYQIFPDRFGFTDDGSAKCGVEYHEKLGQTPELHKSIDEPVRWQPREFEKAYAPDDFYGGNLRGIAKKLPHLKELGIGVIYLNPVFEARSNHRYDTSDYGKIDPILGSNDDYVNLCKEANSLGIAVINDGVFSHTGADSIYFNRYGSYPSVGAYQNRDSRFFPWYDFRHYPDDYRCWWNFKDLPEVNEQNADWQNYVIIGEDSVVRRWLKLGASGWRIDVADELPDEVLSMIRNAAKSENPDSVIIGEVWEDAVTKKSYGKTRNYALGYSLDSVMNYPFRTAVIDFALGRKNSYELRDFLLGQYYNYPYPMYRCLMNLLGSHDVERLHTALAFDYDVKALDRSKQAALELNNEQKMRATALQKLCAAIQYCVPGVPCLYYGDEECLDGGSDPFNRMPFEPSGAGLHNFYTLLGKIRNSNPALTNGSLELCAPDPDIIIIKRQIDNEKIACIINRSSNYYSHPFKGAVSFLRGCESQLLPPLSADIIKLT